MEATEILYGTLPRQQQESRADDAADSVKEDTLVDDKRDAPKYNPAHAAAYLNQAVALREQIQKLEEAKDDLAELDKLNAEL